MLRDGEFQNEGLTTLLSEILLHLVDLADCKG